MVLLLSSRVTVVGGLSPSLCDKPPCDVSFNDLPFVSITALDSSIDSGEDAAFRISVNDTLSSPLRVRYSCAKSTHTVVAAASATHLDDSEVTLQGGSGGFATDITISTNADIARSGRVRCSILDDLSVYRVRGRDAFVSVGFARASDDTRNPELPTVSLVAYKVDDKGHFEELVTDALVGSDDVYFGFVIKDPALLSFDKLDPGTAEWRILKEEVPGVEEGDYEVYADAESSVAITPRLTIKLSGNDGATEYSDDKFDYPGFGSGENRTIVTKAEGRITVRKGDGTSILCGWDGTDAACLVYPPHRGLETVLVNTRCYLDRPGEDPASYWCFCWWSIS